MQNQETKKNSNDISIDKLQQLIRAVALLRKMLKNEQAAKRMMMSISRTYYFGEAYYPFSDN
jgi:hypothetical protein